MTDSLGGTLTVLIPVVILAYAAWLVLRGIKARRQRKHVTGGCGYCKSCGGCPLAESCQVAQTLQKEDGEKKP